jgi:hypothetical protein
MTDDSEKKKVLKQIRKAAREGKIEFADQVEIESIPDNVITTFLRTVFDIDGALVTDESQISDFVPFSDPAIRAKSKQDACLRIYELYGVKCESDDYLWQVLKRIDK